MEKLLEVNDLRTYFFTPDKTIPAVDGVSFISTKVRHSALWGNQEAAKA